MEIKSAPSKSKCDVCKHNMTTFYFDDKVNKQNFCIYCADKTICDDSECGYCNKASLKKYLKHFGWDSNYVNTFPNIQIINDTMFLDFTCIKCNCVFKTYPIQYYYNGGRCIGCTISSEKNLHQYFRHTVC